MNSCRLAILILTLVVMPAHAESPTFGEDLTFSSLAIERLEQQFDIDITVLDMAAWYGTDAHKFVAKLEAELGDDTDYDLELLYGRPFSAYFDFQVGLRIIDHGGTTVTGLVAGFEGMAPYRIELDAAATVTEGGDVLLGAEFERDFLLTEKLILQPRLEIDAALSDVDELGIASGFNNVSVELRARYEFHRKFAPYIGVSWQRALGDTGRLVEAAGGDKNVTITVIGVSFWF